MSIIKIILKSAVQTVRAIVGRSLSEPLISVPEPDSGLMINMTGLYSKSRRDDTLLTVCFSLRYGWHGSAVENSYLFFELNPFNGILGRNAGRHNLHSVRNPDGMQ
jgi:hypothetical protein